MEDKKKSTARYKRLAAAGQILARPAIEVAALAVALTAAAYFIGLNFYMGLLKVFDAAWATQIMDVAIVAQAPLMQVVGVVALSMLGINLYAQGLLDFSGLRRIVIGALVVAALAGVLHLVVSWRWEGYISHWYILVMLAGLVILVGLLVFSVLSIAERRNPQTQEVGVFWGVAIFFTGIAVAPIVGTMRGENALEGDSTNPWVEIDGTRCDWILLAPLTQSEVLIGNIRSEPTAVRVVELKDLVFHPRRSKVLRDIQPDPCDSFLKRG